MPTDNFNFTERRLALIRGGYTPVPLHGKIPPNKKWEQTTNVTPAMLAMWAKTWPDAVNTGVLTRQMPTLDIDIHNEQAVRAIEDHVRACHEEHGPILPRIGKSPKRAIPFRTDEPFTKIVANVIAPNGNTEKIEFLADGQQVVVAGVHPETKQPYRWHGGELGDIKLEELPYIREEEAQRLVDEIVELLVRDFGYQRATERPRKWRKSNGGAGDGAADWQWLFNNISEGRELHDSLRNLAAKMIASGMNPGAAVNQLRALMQASTAPHDERWQARYDEIPRLVESGEEKCRRKAQPEAPPAPARSLAEVHATFQKWLGNDYDISTLDAMLAVAASEKLSGDPAWLLIISGPGNAKTETVQSTSGLGAHVISTIASEGALLSATSQKSRGKTATGGLLRKVGNRGLLVIKDFTSILSADRNTRAPLLAALREIHDGCWVRNVGTDGGQTLTWTGRVVVIGACTTAWDQAHAVIATMGDRFVLVRSDSSTGRVGAGRKAIRNTGTEIAMRQELAEAVAGVIGHINSDQPLDLTDEEVEHILQAADIVTLARTGVEIDYRGDIIDAHAPEMPTRFAKQLSQIMRGALAIGMSRSEAMALVIRCARDSMPPLRLAILEDIGKHPDSRIIDVRRRLQRPRATADRALQALHVLGLLTCREEEEQRDSGPRFIRHYSLAPTARIVSLSVPDL